MRNQEHIKIRPPREADAPDLYQSVTHPAVARNILVVPSMEYSQTEEWVKNHSWNHPRLVAEVDGRAVGAIGLHRSENPRRLHSATLGMNVHPDYWGRGIGSALMAAILDVADNWLNLLRVELEVYTDNERAFHLYEKFGFTVEGTRRMAVYGDGRWADAHVMARITNPPTEPRPAPPERPTTPASPVDPARLLIRTFHRDDLEDLYTLWTDPAVARTTGQLPFNEIGKLRERMASPPAGHHRLAAVLDGRVIGDIHIHQPQNPRQAHSGGLGMAVLPPFWGQGVGSRLMEAILDLADNWLNLKRVELEVNTDNPAGRRLYEKFGFEMEGTLRYHLFGDGRWADSYFMARLR